ncbi:MAG: putative ATP-dependent DNA helicase [Prokaryotic dsDNA virus sp.]|nr:MAG: putative ATP-dependent DNA helicase [Prokaryotic dsDNA virus sp.]|tara:strand:+ start:13267 stop:14868 length:1602 start_codon:yes stop_codon:yes gene_type:complete
MQLRDYQQEAVDSLYTWFDAGKGNPLVVAPTGAGKSVILSEFVRSAVTQYPGTKVIAVTHVKELIQQNAKALLRMWPAAPVGIYSAGLNAKQTGRQITFAGIQSVAKKADRFGSVDLIVVDECHLIPRNPKTLYGKFFDAIRAINPAVKIVGLSATPFRLDSGRLDAGDDALFEGIAYDIPVGMLVTRGYLAPLISKRPDMVFDTSGLHKRGGDYIEGEMDARFNTDDVTRQAVAETIALGHDRKSWLLFCISVSHALAVRDELVRNGISAATVTGDTPPADRARILEDFKAGRIRAITNVNVLTTGFDAPSTDLLAFLRPTQSLGLYMQMAGRAMRTAHGKDNGLVLDFAGNVAKHGPVDAVMLPDDKAKGKGDGEAPTKTCPQCQEIVFAGARECGCCGYEFPPPEIKIDHTASTAAIMNMTAVEDWRPVTDFAVALHKKPGGDLASMRAEYLIDGKVIKEWVCFDHAGFPRQQAVRWWNQNAGTTAPESVADALERQSEIRPPEEAVVRREGKYDRVVRVRGMMADRRVA